MRATMLLFGGATALLMAVPMATAGRSAPATGADHLAMESVELAHPMADALVQGQGKAQGQAQAQGQGQGQDQGPPGARGQGRGQGQGPPGARGRANPPPDRATFNRGLAERAIQARTRRNAGARGMSVRREGGNVRFLRDDGTALFELREDAADRMGYWWVNRVLGTDEAARRAGPDRDRERDGGGIFPDILGNEDEGARGGAPAFCQSGEGHSVWGRAWCVDKGFGLGERDGRWGWARTEDVTLRNPDPDRDVFDQGGLIDILGDVVFGRLAVQSLVLGADEPLSGRWIGQNDGPRVLRITAGDLPVAELVDAGRDGSVDAIVFNLGG